MKLTGKGLVMKKIISFAVLGMLSLLLAAPAFAGRGHGGGFHGGFHNGGHPGRFHRFGPVFVGGVFVGSALAYPYYAYPYYSYPPYAYPPYSQPAYEPVVAAAPLVQRDVCYVGGCYRLQGDGVSVAYQWIWVPAAAPPPPPPPGPPIR